MKNLPNASSFDIKILATDVSPRVLKEATKGVYGPKAIANLNQSYLSFIFYAMILVARTVLKMQWKIFRFEGSI